MRHGLTFLAAVELLFEASTAFAGIADQETVIRAAIHQLYDGGHYPFTIAVPGTCRNRRTGRGGLIAPGDAVLRPVTAELKRLKRPSI